MGILTSQGRIIGIWFLVTSLIGFVHASAIMYIFSVVIMGGLLTAWVLALWGSKDITISREVHASTVTSGDPLPTRLNIHESKARWRMLELHDNHTNLINDEASHRQLTLLLEDTRSSTATIGGKRQQMTQLGGKKRELLIPDMLRFPYRGLYRLGPIELQSYDPFGLIYVVRKIEIDKEVIVYPRALSMPDALLTGAGGRQESAIRPSGRAGESAEFHSIRPYTEGDDLRRVHWKASAHSDKMVVKEYEYRNAGAVQVILDLQGNVHAGNGYNSTLEKAITLSSSVLTHVIGAGNQIGLFTTGEKIIQLPQESGQRQLHRALETLALAKADGTATLAQTLLSNEAPSSRRCTTIVITPSLDVNLIGALLNLRGKSAQLLLVLLDPSQYQIKEQSDPATHPSTIKGISNYFEGLDLLKTDSKKVEAQRNEHKRLLNAAIAAGIEVVSLDSEAPLNKALQAIGRFT